MGLHFGHVCTMCSKDKDLWQQYAVEFWAHSHMLHDDTVTEKYEHFMQANRDTGVILITIQREKIKQFPADARVIVDHEKALSTGHLQ